MPDLAEKNNQKVELKSTDTISASISRDELQYKAEQQILHLRRAEASPGGVDGVADGDHVACPAHIQVRPREGDEARVGHGVLVPTSVTQMNQPVGNI